jgi:chitin synthase
LLAFKGIGNLSKDLKRPLGFSDVFTNAIFRNIIVSLMATLGLYIFASLIFVRVSPAHFFGSWIETGFSDSSSRGT